MATTASTAANADISCDEDADDDVSKNICQAYSVGCAIMMIGAACMVLGAAMYANEKASNGLFGIGLAMLSGGLGCVASGNAQNACEEQGADDDAIYCNSFSVASTAFFISAGGHFIGSILVSAGQDKPGFALFFVGLSMYAGGYTSQAGGDSNFYCDLEENNIIPQFDDALKALCDGYSASAVFHAVAMGAAGFFAVALLVASTDENKVTRRWVGWFIFFAALCIGFTASTSGESDANCALEEEASGSAADTYERYCDGLSSSAVFSGIAGVVSVVAIIMAASSSMKGRNTLFMAALALFMVAFGAYYSTAADESCQDAEDFDDDGLQTQCDGQSAAAIFSMIGAAVFAVGAVVGLIAE